ncbi:GGDEF domain-containing protein [Rhizobium rhododendri]|uniref:diguanylate cyclase n=1 Tax=Rhizobium rhododendri TaxID=2506430 RepID=A0ABY8IN84_9HYPH|nr:GGDEF domain-containing protein [Rhizobium rhododendri]WFS25186.1 GGDEF domain-containing protein [Rhizobium rhododendri]
MAFSIERYIERACATDRFESREQVWLFAVRMTAAVTITADLLNLVAHFSLNALGLLPYDVVPAAAVGFIISTLVASGITFPVVYVVGLAIHHLTISRATFERLSRTDMLSGLLNRRAFLDEVSLAPRSSSLVLFDIDKFKAINDQHGHAFGDQAIIAVSNQLAEFFGADHPVARIGGEEFAVLICKLTPSERLALAKRFGEMVAARGVMSGSGRVAVTVSGGVADQEDYSSFEMLFSACDQALYLAKSSGRNCVIHSGHLAASWG